MDDNDGCLAFLFFGFVVALVVAWLLGEWVEIPGEVVSKHTNAYRSTTYYRVVVALEDSEELMEVEATINQYYSIELGQSVTVRFRKIGDIRLAKRLVE